MVDDAFAEHRSLLFTIAYEMLGTVTDAEDVLQESYLRWRAVDQDGVEYPRAYLVRLVTRQALNQLRTVRARREDYVGPWLPEPIRTAPDVSDDAILAESVSMAMMLVLETLNPTERAVFVLHDVFGYTHPEIAASIGKTEVAVRQIAHRAREHVHARRRRFEPDSSASRQVVRRFMRAATTGAVQDLMDLLAPDVVEISDGGGKVVAAGRPITGRDAVVRFVLGVVRTNTVDSGEPDTYNGMPAIRFTTDGELDWLAAFEIHDGRITGIYGIRNPDKLHGARGATARQRRTDMQTMTVERVIDAPIDDVFAWLTTTTNYTASPLVVRCRLTRRGEGAAYGVGAVRSHLWLIGWFRERITRHDPPHVTEYVVEASVPPARHELGRMRFTEVDGGTLVVWTTRAEIRLPLVGALLTRRVARPVITRTFGTILAAADRVLTSR